MYKNFWLGDNELIINFNEGHCRVLERYENYNIVFVGNYKECEEYCEKRVIEYEESIIG